MSSKLHSASTVLATTVALTLCAAAANAAPGLPAVQHNGSVEFITGGIGSDEATAMKQASAHWPLTLEFAIREKASAAFVSGVKVEVRDARGQAELATTTNGPFMLAKLPPGRYTITAILDGRTLREPAQVRAGHPTKATFVWPHGTDGTTS